MRSVANIQPDTSNTWSKNKFFVIVDHTDLGMGYYYPKLSNGRASVPTQSLHFYPLHSSAPLNTCPIIRRLWAYSGVYSGRLCSLHPASWNQHAAPGVVHGLATAWASPGNWFRMQNISLPLQHLPFNKTSRWCLFTLMCKKCWLNTPAQQLCSMKGEDQRAISWKWKGTSMHLFSSPLRDQRGKNHVL